MGTTIQANEYRLSFGEDAKRIEFRARGIVQAIIRAEDLLAPGQSATLLEDGVPMCSLSTDGFLMFPEHCRPVTGF
jgi:hypothetical protein